jgi:TetR/AcrR family transcriptional regulator, regulator of cefoperazone and chloramphenicol sensitivity
MKARSTSHSSQGRSSLRERHAALTRSVILEVARRRFAEQGYAATAVRPIAAEAGISLQTLYSAFGSKQGLLLGLVDTVREQTDAADTWERMERSEDPLELTALAARLRRQILERCGDIVITFREGAAGDPEVAASYEEGQRRTREGVTHMCERLQALGALGRGVTLKRAVDQVAALFSAEIYEELCHRSGWSPDEYEDWLNERLREVLLEPDRAGRAPRRRT